MNDRVERIVVEGSEDLAPEKEVEIKRTINNLVWENGRGTMTLNQAETLASEVFYRLLEGLRR